VCATLRLHCLVDAQLLEKGTAQHRNEVIATRKIQVLKRGHIARIHINSDVVLLQSVSKFMGISADTVIGERVDNGDAMNSSR